MNFSMASKDFKGLWKKPPVLQNAAIDFYPYGNWRPLSKGKRQFFSLCVSNGSIEALYRQGLDLYFCTKTKKNEGFNLLLRAAVGGHMTASYLVSLVGLSGNDCVSKEFLGKIGYHDLHQVFQLIRCQKNIINCRTSLEESIQRMTLLDSDSLDRSRFLCDARTCKIGWTLKPSTWIFHNEEQDTNDPKTCLNCRIDYELRWLYSIIRNNGSWRRGLMRFF